MKKVPLTLLLGICINFAGQLFYVVCGSKYDRYLEAHSVNNMNILQGVTDKDSACVFYVKETKGPYKYKLLMYHEDSDKLFVARNEKRATGRGSVQVGGGYSIKFSLDADGTNGLTISDWETKPCRINVAPQLKKKGYNAGFLGFSERQHMCEFVAEGSAEAEGKMWLHFKLERVEDSSMGPVSRAPRGMRVKAPIIVRPCIDSDSDDEPQFGSDF